MNKRGTGFLLLIAIMVVGGVLYVGKQVGISITGLPQIPGIQNPASPENAASNPGQTDAAAQNEARKPLGAVAGSNPMAVAQAIIESLRQSGSPNLEPDMTAYEEGIAAYEKGDYADAINKLSRTKSSPRDMLVPVLLENSRVFLEGKETVEIAVAGPMTGDSAPKGHAELAGVALAQQEINRNGGIAGKKLIVRIADDKGKKGEATKTVAQALVHSNVVAVVGHIGSSNTLDAAEVYEAGELPAVSPSSSSPLISDAGDYIFRVCPDDKAQGRALAEYAKQIGVKQAAIVYNPGDTYSRTLYESISDQMSRLGIAAGGEFVYDTEAMDFAQTAADIKASGSDAVFFSGSNVEGAYFIMEMNQTAPNIKILTGDAMYVKPLLDVAGAKANGVITTTFFHANAGFPFEAHFVQASTAKFKGTPNARSALAYDAVNAIGRAMEETQSATREGVKKGLMSVSFEGATGRIRFNNKGDARNKPIVILQIKNQAFVPVKALYDKP